MTDLTAETELTAETIEARRQKRVDSERVVFRVSGLYGMCPKGVRAPFGAGAEMESGAIAVTIDPAAGSNYNVGLIDFPENKLKVRYGVQAVFPALYQLAQSGEHDLGLFNPVRVVATDDCTLTPSLMGWRALGCLDFLPGSVWSGATGG